MVFIYVLQCEENKWYVGKTITNKFRIDTHFDSNGSEFTKKYKPVEIYQIIPECDKYDEDKYVKKYMDKYGIDNVRGGTYSRLELTNEEKAYIQKELWGANDLCFICGGDHFVKDCPNNIKNEDLVDNNYIIDKEILNIVLKRITSNSDIYNGKCLDMVIFKDTQYSTGEVLKWGVSASQNGNWPNINRIHLEEYISLDSYIISKYVNNNNEIIDLYKTYINKLFILIGNDNIINYFNGCGTIMSRLRIKQMDLAHKYIYPIIDKIKILIKNISYIQLHNIIINNYKLNYIITNFSININFQNMDINEIFRNICINYYTEDCININNFPPHLNRTRSDHYVYSKDNIHLNTTKLADINIKGELYYD